ALVDFISAHLDGSDSTASPAAPASEASPREARGGRTTGGVSPEIGSRALLARRMAPLAALLERARQADAYYFETPVEALDGPWVRTQAGERKLMFATYSYLGLLGHPA